MEITVVEESKRKLVVEFDSDHGFCNLLTSELWNDKGVTVASYSIDHPLVGKPKMIIETNNTQEPRKALKDAISRLKKQATKFKDEVAKIK